MRARLLLLVLVAAVSLAACTAKEPVKIDQSSPQRLVADYLDALVAGDDDVARSVLTADSTMADGAGSWLTSPPALSDIHVGSQRVPFGELPPQEQAYPEVLEVPVTFTLQTNGDDGFSSGHTVWGYRVVRHSDQEPWQISSEGV